jgi:hypothetical protein
MFICVRCDGNGFEQFIEDDRYCRDACYHCAGSGKVDDDTAYYDLLSQVAKKLAYRHVCELRDYRNSDPDGEGWDFCAAENMMSGRDYFDMYVYDYTAIFNDQLMNMGLAEIQLLMAWNQTS